MESGNSAATSSSPNRAASAAAPRNTFIVCGVDGYHWKKLETLKAKQNG